MKENNGNGIKRKRIRRKHSLPRGDIKFENEIAILKGFVEFSNKGKKPVKYDEIRVIKVHKTIISSELNFFADIGLAEKVKGSRYRPTSKTIDFVNNLNWGKEKKAKNVLRSVLLDCWFGKLVSKLLTISVEVTVDDLIQELGIEAEADPEKDKKSVERLVEWLEYANVIEMDENKKVTLKQDSILAPEEVQETTIETTKKEEKQLQKISKAEISISFLVQVTPQTKKEEIEKIIKIIKEVIREDKVQ